MKQFLSHLDLEMLFQNAPTLCHLDMTYGVKSIGVHHEPTLARALALTPTPTPTPTPNPILALTVTLALTPTLGLSLTLTRRCSTTSNGRSWWRASR